MGRYEMGTAQTVLLLRGFKFNASFHICWKQDACIKLYSGANLYHHSKWECNVIEESSHFEGKEDRERKLKLAGGSILLQ